jgi:hypothetical protein
MTIKYANGRKIFQRAIKFNKIVHIKVLQNLHQLGIFGLKIYHLATMSDGRRKFIFPSLK